MPAWFQRLNSRERVLSLIVAGALFLLINLFIWSALLGSLGKARADLASRKAMRKEQTMFLKEQAMWEKRADWLKEKQPALKSPGEASTLLEEVKQAAGKHKVLMENPAIGTSDTTPNYQAVFASIETKSQWSDLGSFSLRHPETRIVCCF